MRDHKMQPSRPHKMRGHGRERLGLKACSPRMRAVTGEGRIFLKCENLLKNLTLIAIDRKVRFFDRFYDRFFSCIGWVLVISNSSNLRDSISIFQMFQKRLNWEGRTWLK